MRVPSLSSFQSGVAPSRAWRLLPTLLIAVGAIILLFRQIEGLDLSRVFAMFHAIAFWQWLVALAATTVSFYALGQYDVQWHRALNTGVKPERARRAGMASIAIGQTIGCASVTSSLARWRCLPNLSVMEIAKLTAAVSLSFMAVWAVLASIALSTHMNALPGFEVRPWMIVVLVTSIAAAVTFAVKTTKLSAAGIVKLILWSVVDLSAASTVLWVLLPAGTDVGWWPFLAGFILAFGAGLIFNSPGGVGPFELVLLGAFPIIQQEAVICALLGYRIIYFLIPFVIGVTYALCCRPVPKASVSGPADWRLAQQSGRLQRFESSWAHVLTPIPGYCVAIGNPEPLARSAGASIVPPKGLRTIYKADARLAASARRLGWTTALIANEAVVDPKTFALDGSKKARLRKALRKADQGGVQIQSHPINLPLTDMARIAKDWAKTHGGELGATLGRFEADYVRQQRVFMITKNDRLCGFITFNTDRDWALDLIRYEGSLPKGAIEKAIVTAIEAAKNAGITRLSLAAIPAETGASAKWCGAKSGLSQFKRQFDPKWEPKYFISQTRLEYVLSGLALVLVIQRPLARQVERIMWKAHDLLAKFEFASPSRARDTRADFDAKDTECSPLPTR